VEKGLYIIAAPLLAFQAAGMPPNVNDQQRNNAPQGEILVLFHLQDNQTPAGGS